MITHAQQPARDAAAPPITGTAILAGVVIADEPNGRPVRRAVVRINNSEVRAASRATITDDRGRFAVSELPGGRYTLTVSKPGWVETYYGARRPGRGPGLPLALADGQTMGDLSVKLLRGGVIAGRIVNQVGNPQAGLRVMAMEYRTSGGQRILSQVITTAILGVQTDDRGEFRMYGLPPGQYIVGASALGGLSPTSGIRTTSPEEIRWALQQTAATPPIAAAPPPGGAVTYAPMYYPGTTEPADAVTVTLGPGEERTGVDFAISAVAVSRVQGTVRRADGLPIRAPQIALTQAEGTLNVMSLVSLVNRGSIDPAGNFTFAAVRPGRYVLTVRAPSQVPPPPERPVPGTGPVRRPAPTLDLWASTEISVQGTDIAGLALTLEPGMTISGKIVFEASRLEPPSDLSRVRLQMGPPALRVAGSLTGTNLYLGSATPEATFSIGGVSPGPYVLSAFMPQTSAAGPDWVVKSVVAKGQNVLDRPFEVRAGEDVTDVVVTLSDRVTELSGTLQDGLGRPAPEYSVFVIPADRQYWTSMSTRMRPPVRPASDGRYRIRGLPPGEYFVAALGEVEEADYLDAAFLDQVAAAAFKITLAEGETKQQDLRLQGSDPRRSADAGAARPGARARDPR